MPSKTGVLEAGTHLIREEYGTSMHEDEVRETMYAGECLGFKMDGFKDQVKSLLNDAGMNNVS